MVSRNLDAASGRDALYGGVGNGEHWSMDCILNDMKAHASGIIQAFFFDVAIIALEYSMPLTTIPSVT